MYFFSFPHARLSLFSRSRKKKCEGFEHQHLTCFQGSTNTYILGNWVRNTNELLQKKNLLLFFLLIRLFFRGISRSISKYHCPSRIINFFFFIGIKINQCFGCEVASCLFVRVASTVSFLKLKLLIRVGYSWWRDVT